MEKKKGTVLVIDDSLACAYQLFEVLGSDYHVLAATGGAEGIEIATGQSPDIILLDVVMPEMDGHEVCIHLKEDSRTRDIPIMFITAREDEEDEEHGLSLGAIDYLSKPLRPAIIRARIKNHIELKHNRDLLQRLTMVDPLTGINNRRRFDQYLDSELARMKREEKALTLIMIDVDHFKNFNDFYGHSLGDQCLSRVASVLQGEILRPADLVARYGGEEFACISPDTDLGGALQLAERMRAAVEALAIPHADSRTAAHVTISLGIATFAPPGAISPNKLIEAADQALYEAKEKGRNRICVHHQAGVSHDL